MDNTPTTPTTALEALAAVRAYASRTLAALPAPRPAADRKNARRQGWLAGYRHAMKCLERKIDRMVARQPSPTTPAAPAAQPTTPATTTAFARTDLATAAQAALGIEAYALHIPNIFDPAGPKDIQGWVCSPRHSHPQYVGYAIESDGGTALQRLETKIVVFTSDIEAELAPAPPSPPAAPAAFPPVFVCQTCGGLVTDPIHQDGRDDGHAYIPTWNELPTPAMVADLHTRTFPTYNNETHQWEIQLSTGETFTHLVSANLCIDAADRRLMELNAAALAPAPSSPAAAAAPTRRTKKTVRAARKPVGCQCPPCLRISPPAAGVYGCSVGLEYHIYAGPDHYLGSRSEYREAVDVLSAYRTGGRRAA